MTFVMILGTSLAIGIVAQVVKGRPGAAWWLLSLMAGIILWIVFFFGISIVDRSFWLVTANWYALAFLVCVAVAILFTIIIATLPSQLRGSSFS